MVMRVVVWGISQSDFNRILVWGYAILVSYGRTGVASYQGMSSLKNHVPEIVVMETLLVGDDVQGYVCRFVGDVGRYLHGKASMVEFLCGNRDSWDCDVLGKELGSRPSAPCQFILTLDYGLGLVDGSEICLKVICPIDP